LLFHTIHGLFNTSSKITGALGNGLATLTMDDSYLHERELSNQMKPQHVGEGISLGFREFAMGLYKGMSSLIKTNQEPDHSVRGILRGTTKNALGFAVKPVVGMFDFVTRTAQALSVSTEINKKLIQPRRPPRYLTFESISEPYSIEKSHGQALLHEIRGGTYRSEKYVGHFPLKSNILLISSAHIILITKQSFEEKWALRLRDIKKIDKTSDSITFHLAEPQHVESQIISSRRIHVANAVVDVIKTTVELLCSAEQQTPLL
jgi:hypothetical protein